MSRLRTAILFLLLAALPSCQLPAPSPESSRWIRTYLYLGLTRRDSSLIPNADFQSFIDHSVTPAFPDGLTITPASGQYMDSHHTLHQEPTRIVTILYPQSAATIDNQKINQISAAYCRQFNQESVLRTDTPAQTHFLAAP